MKDKHGLTGNRNAAHGDDNKSSNIFARTTPTQKASYVKAANGEKLCSWILKTLDKEANK